MQWIDENDLVRWAIRLDARALLADLVADLILATAGTPRRMRFPGGDVSQIAGWDGDLEVDAAQGLVPAGRSKWEFGTSPGATKAKRDYDKRTCETKQQEREDNTLVLVNLHTWKAKKPKLADWEKARNDERTWRKVRYIDGVELVHCLDMHPAVAARYGRKVLDSAPRHGPPPLQDGTDEASVQPAHSAWLRDGLDQTLAIIATLHATAGLQVFAGTAQDFVDETISSMPGWGQNHASLVRLGAKAT